MTISSPLRHLQEFADDATNRFIVELIVFVIILVLLNAVAFGRFKCHRHFFACIQKHRFANFAGRSRRSEYIGFYVSNFVFMMDLLFLDSILNLLITVLFNIILVVPPPLTIMFAFFTFVPACALIVRRLHDIGVSGWAALIVLVPVLGVLLQLVLCFLDSKVGRNAWGPNPKQMEHDGMEDMSMMIPMAEAVPAFAINTSSALIQNSHDGSVPDAELGFLDDASQDRIQIAVTEK